MTNLSVTVHIFKEGSSYVAHVPELDLSTCGASVEEARKNVRDAVEGFLATADEQGTLAEVLEEAGFQYDGQNWQAPEFVELDRLNVNVQ